MFYTLYFYCLRKILFLSPPSPNTYGDMLSPPIYGSSFSLSESSGLEGVSFAFKGHVDAGYPGAPFSGDCHDTGGTTYGKTPVLRYGEAKIGTF